MLAIGTDAVGGSSNQPSGNYQGDDGAWYTPEGYYIGGGDGSKNGTQSSTESIIDRFFGNKDSTYDAIESWARANGYKFNSDTIDYLYQQYFTEKNNATAWERTLEADQTKYQRAVDDMKKAGLNPFLAVNGGASNAGTASAGNVSGGSIASILGSKKAQQTGITHSVLGMLGLIAGALIYALI